MIPTRPDLSSLPSDKLHYIEALEAEIECLKAVNIQTTSPSRKVSDHAYNDLTQIDEPAEAPTTMNVITISSSGIAKRTARHLYTRQRRGGMGLFDLDTSQEDPPAILTIAEQSSILLLITSEAHAFRLPVSAILETPVRSRGASIVNKLGLVSGENLVVVIPEQAQGYLALLSLNGMVRLVRHHVFGEYMKPGTTLCDLRNFGPLAAACWTPGDSDLFIATRHGRAIRFSEKLVPPSGTQGIRLADQDQAISVTPVYPTSNVFLLGADGRGTVRMMENFLPNKAPGVGGKIAMNTDHLVCALNIDDQEDIFIISKLAKIIRFKAEEIPPKEGVVQGVNCMSLRSDQPVSVALHPSGS
jgi:DNA gyrase subunit A